MKTKTLDMILMGTLIILLFLYFGLKNSNNNLHAIDDPGKDAIKNTTNVYEKIKKQNEGIDETIKKNDNFLNSNSRNKFKHI